MVLFWVIVIVIIAVVATYFMVRIQHDDGTSYIDEEIDEENEEKYEQIHEALQETPGAKISGRRVDDGYEITVYTDE